MLMFQWLTGFHFQHVELGTTLKLTKTPEAILALGDKYTPGTKHADKHR
jgi:heme/copper-type cytochrome/quinol oxidase subunit 3